MRRTKFARYYRNYSDVMRKHAALKDHLLLPAIGAGVGGVASLITGRKTKTTLLEKIKKLIRNAALGAVVGGGLEGARVGIKNIMDTGLGPTIEGDTTVDGNYTID